MAGKYSFDHVLVRKERRRRGGGSCIVRAAHDSLYCRQESGFGRVAETLTQAHRQASALSRFRFLFVYLICLVRKGPCRLAIVPCDTDRVIAVVAGVYFPATRN